ncbi:MAG: creatininase family protein, partial [bacterium]
MGKQPHVLSEARYRDIKDVRYEVAVLPWGATEAHNLHLPYGTDIYEADAFARESARIASDRGARVIVLPAIPFGVNTTQLDINLTINMNPSTQMAILSDVAASLEQHSVGKLLILNSHGGNDFKQMIRELHLRHTMFICAANWFRSFDLRNYFDEPGDHADEMETSVMIHLAPELVLPLSEAGSGARRKSKITAFREGWAWSPRRWTDVTSDTGVGNPRAATAEKGKKYFDDVAAKLAQLIVELDAADVNNLY